MKLIGKILMLCCLLVSSNLWAEAASHYPIPLHLYDDVDLIPEVKYQHVKPNIRIKSVYPQLQSDSDNTSIHYFNELVKENIQLITDRFVKETRQIKVSNLHQRVNSELLVDYDAALINAKSNRLLSIRFIIQSYQVGMAHPSHYHQVLNYNLTNGKIIELKDLFLPHAEFLPLFSQYVRVILNKRLTNKDFIETGTTPNLDHFKNWNIKSQGIAITFEEAQVAPYVYGSQTVLIPYKILKSLISPSSIIFICTKHPKRCLQGQQLTGGFIDSITG